LKYGVTGGGVVESGDSEYNGNPANKLMYHHECGGLQSEKIIEGAAS
jgi:hypothetical protein